VRKFNRWHHQVDYRRFKYNKLKRISDPPDGINNFGMELKTATNRLDIPTVPSRDNLKIINLGLSSEHQDGVFLETRR